MQFDHIEIIAVSPSQNVLEDVPDFAERKRLLESLKNKLEALLSTKLVTAFNGHLLGKKLHFFLLAILFKRLFPSFFMLSFQISLKSFIP